MPRPSPIAAGFRTAFFRPALLAGEIAWRWSCGAAAWLMILFASFTYLDSIRLSNADLVLLRSRVPPLMAEAVRRMLEGTGPQLLRAAAVLLPAMAALWVAGASFGRWASLHALIKEPGGRFRSVLGLHFLRAAAALAAWIGYLGALLAAGYFASRGLEDRPGLFLLIFFVLAAIIGFFHGRLRWYLFLANILAVRDGSDALASIATAFDAYRSRRARFLTLALAMGAIRLGLITGVTVLSLVPIGLIAGSAWRLLVLILVLITLAYFVVADFLFVARLAAYVEILRDGPESQPVAAPEQPLDPALQSSASSLPEPQASDTAGATGTSAIGTG